MPTHEGISPAENMIAHVIDIGANYWSLWNFHQISATNLMSYYQTYPTAFDRINRRIGYRVRPSFIWSYKDSSYLGLIVGFANDGIAGVPGVLRVTVESRMGRRSRAVVWTQVIRCPARFGKHNWSCRTSQIGKG